LKKVLIIKTSSLGDIIHTLPAISDATQQINNIQFDWLIEENFTAIPHWHPSVQHVIPVAIRRWRKQLIQTLRSGQWQQFKQRLQQQQYDLIIDAQGLLKSAWLTHLAKGHRYGLDKHSAREPLASYFYQHPQAVNKQQHAVERVRQLFAQSLNYSYQNLPLNYGISEHLSALTDLNTLTQRATENPNNPTILFLHGTTWASKHWPEHYWIKLAQTLIAEQYKILLPWGNAAEYQRALRIQQHAVQSNSTTINDHQSIIILTKMNLDQLAQQILTVDAVIAVDTGLAHLAAALNRPTIALYGPTSSGLTGTYGDHQIHLQSTFSCAPCFKKSCQKINDGINPACYSQLTPEKIHRKVKQLLFPNNPTPNLL
jgi:heptosyltransferase-1